MANDPKNPFAWNPKKSSGQTAFTGDSYKVASTGGGTAMSKENPNEGLPVMNGVESLYYQEPENYVKRFGTGLINSVVGMVTEPFLQTYDLGVAATSFVYNETTNAITGKNPLWFPQTYSGVSKAYENGASQFRLFAQSNPISGIGVTSYDMTTSGIEGRWGDFTEQTGGLLGGLALGKAVSKYGNWTKTIDGQTATVKLTEGLNEIDFTRKINRLNNAAGETGLLPKDVVTTASERQALTRAYRKELTERIDSFYKNNPEARQSALAKLKTSDIDHIVDLQLGGKNKINGV